MLHIRDQRLKELLFDGLFGLERESLRITGDGRFSHTHHPFPEDDHIVRDFCENQTEINTAPHESPEAAVEELRALDARLRASLRDLPEPEYLWTSSNPPYIADEDDIPVAAFTGSQFHKSIYRDYLSEKYGRYKMTFSGIHVNFSFSEELLARDFALSGESDPMLHRSRLYMDLASGLLEYGWILTCLTAASPLLDGSFYETGKRGSTVFSGMASVRCSELGYWNEFIPVLDYTSLTKYAGSIRRYVREGWLNAPSELYYPIRLKSKGENDLDTLEQSGVNHIELRMFDLNPFLPWNLDVRDVKFAHLLMLWLASGDSRPPSPRDQVRAVGNYKRAAHYDLHSVNYIRRDGSAIPMDEACLRILGSMQRFFEKLSADCQGLLDYQCRKLTDETKRYASAVRMRYEDRFADRILQELKGEETGNHV